MQMCKNVDNDVSKDPPYSYQLILSSTAKPRLLIRQVISGDKLVKNKLREKGLQIKFLRSTVLYLFIETIIFHEFKS